MENFIDCNGISITDGAKCQYTGEMPEKLKAINLSNIGFIKYIANNMLGFFTAINGELYATGLFWTFDNTPCYDLVVI